MYRSRIPVVVIVALLLAFAVPALAQTVAPKGDEAKLIAVLQSADASRKDKIDACRQLAIIGGKDSIAPLAALLGNEATVKRFHQRRGRVVLEPENPEFEPIIVSPDRQDFQLIGVVVGLLRNYR